jgi:hypothetical protein
MEVKFGDKMERMINNREMGPKRTSSSKGNMVTNNNLRNCIPRAGEWEI